MSREASNALAQAAREGLGSLAMERKGRSRTSCNDHGWWLVVVEFQPSQNGRFYLNVGNNIPSFVGVQGQVHQAHRLIADEYVRALDAGTVDELARSMTTETRAALRLPPTTAYSTKSCRTGAAGSGSSS